MEKNKNTKKFTVKLLPILLVLFIIFITWYLFLPALNLNSVKFWIYIIFNLIIIATASSIFYKQFYRLYIIPGMLVILMIILLIFSSKIFNAKKYSNLITKVDGSFEEDVRQISFSQVPTIDRDTAQRLGSRKMGEMLELVSQYNISNSYTQINHNNKPVRVTPLEYNGFLKWLGNKNEGIPNYIMVDMIDGDVDLIKLTSNIKYSKSDKFSRDISRHIRFSYPLDIAIKSEFEVDESGTPYWITPLYKTNIGWFGGLDISDVVITNAITGENTKYKVEDVPNWVDRAYNSERIIEQLNWNGKLHLGFFNSLFSQKGVTMTTEGYNYLAIDNDVYLYTGITSVGTDESNIGFVLVNLRTKETKFYKVSSAEEFSAMESAQGAVQEKGYIATFPILLNINNKPTYFMSLKDGAGLIKGYALVDAENYQEVTIGKSVNEILSIHSGNNPNDLELNTDNKEVETHKEKGVILDIKSTVVGGNTHYYMVIMENIFVANINISKELPFLAIGGEVEIEYIKELGINKITKISLTK